MQEKQEEIKLEPKHILCVNWYIFSKLWRKIYKEIWETSDPDKRDNKFRLETEFPIEVTVKRMIYLENKESFKLEKAVEAFNFYKLFYIPYKYYDAIMHGVDLDVANEQLYNKKKVKKLSEMTDLHSSIFTGEECLIPISNNTLPKLHRFAEARFSSSNSYGYRDESKTIDKLIQEYLYLPNMQIATAFIKSRGEIKAEQNAIERNKAFLESTKYTELLRSDNLTLNSYKKCLREHLEKVNSCIIYNKNKNF